MYTRDKTLKYIVMADGFAWQMFPGHLEHADVAAGRPVRSAGFIQFREDDTVECYGKSVSLSIGPDPDDEKLLSIYFRAGDPPASVT